ncbi:competence/damage-inducible protein A [Fusibacter sp. JL216-2]|uniref:competence/damage-inducible protein A n=1 Tax=Fusibacter sp. JL216-2 TaxID=3071453 RepID=UPI003D3510B6
MKAAIIAVGTELLMGKVTNTNAVYLSSVLNELGVSVLYHITVGDNPRRLEEAVKSYFDEVDIIITTGGLGPTQDDLTKEIVSQAMGVEVGLDPDLVRDIEAYFESLGRKMTASNRKQAAKPAGAIVMKNTQGTAPGFILEKDGKTAVMMPGPPRELEAMTQTGLVPYLKSKHSEEITSKWIRVFGIGESTVETMIEDLVSGQTNPTLATYVKDGSVAIRVTANGTTEAENEALMEPVVKKIRDRFKDNIYSMEDETLDACLAKILIENNIHFSLAESCTGGMIAASLVGQSGISKVFDRGYVTYSNEAKMEELGVSDQTLKAFGAVSSQTAEEMVRGLRSRLGSDLCISVTGIAGPGGGTADKPVGLVYIGLLYKGQVKVFKHQFHGDRKRIRRFSANYALDHARRMIKGK